MSARTPAVVLAAALALALGHGLARARGKVRCATRSAQPQAQPPVPPPAPNTLRFHFLEIGAGLCTLIECPGDTAEAVVVDCGASKGPHAMTSDQVFAYLDARLVGRRYSVVVSHGDWDHYSLLQPYAQAPGGKATRVIYGGDYGDYTCAAGAGTVSLFGGSQITPVGPSAATPTDADDEMDLAADDDEMDLVADDAMIVDNPPQEPPAPDYRGRDLGPGLIAAMDQFDDKGILLGGPRYMPQFQCGKATFYIVTAPRKPAQTNARSVVLLVKYGDFEAVLPGDAEGMTERAALDNTEALRRLGSERISPPIELIASAHHGASTKDSNSPAWIRFMHAKAVVFSSGARENAATDHPVTYFGHPRTAVAAAFANDGVARLADECEHTLVHCASGASCALAKVHHALFSTAVSGTVLVDAAASGAFTVHYGGKSPPWLPGLAVEKGSCAVDPPVVPVVTP